MGQKAPLLEKGLAMIDTTNSINILLTSPTIFTKLTYVSSDNHISPNLPLQPSSHETSHTLQLISPTLIQIYNFLYMTLVPGV